MARAALGKESAALPADMPRLIGEDPNERGVGAFANHFHGLLGTGTGDDVQPRADGTSAALLAASPANRQVQPAAEFLRVAFEDSLLVLIHTERFRGGSFVANRFFAQLEV